VKYIKNFGEIFEATAKPEQWWKKFTKYKLSAYPVNIPEEDVTVDLSGDIHTHPVLTWNSPATGKKVYAYTKERMDAQRAEKYERVSRLSQEQIDKMKIVCHDIIVGDSPDLDKQAAAIVSIIAQTGLRPGSKKGFEETHNRGVITLAVENVTIQGSKVKLNFTGKSYADNVAEFEDGAVAHYLETRMKKMRKRIPPMKRKMILKMKKTKTKRK
jgi:DNA topoisomerase IB